MPLRPTSPPSEMPGDLISVRDAADLIAVSVATIYRIIGEGHLHAWRRVGGHCRVSKAEVVALMRPVEVRHARDSIFVDADEQAAQDAVVRLRDKGYRAG